MLHTDVSINKGGSCWIPGAWRCRWRTTRLLSFSLPGSLYLSIALKMSHDSRTPLEHKTPESNKSAGGMWTFFLRHRLSIERMGRYASWRHLPTDRDWC